MANWAARRGVDSWLGTRRVSQDTALEFANCVATKGTVLLVWVVSGIIPPLRIVNHDLRLFGSYLTLPFSFPGVATV